MRLRARAIAASLLIEAAALAVAPVRGPTPEARRVRP